MMISISGMATVIVYLIIAALVFWLLHWLIGYVGLQEPWNKVARVVLAICAVLVIIGILLSVVSDRPIFRP